ncbi:PREDICTED: uncharacterized protein LOC108762287 [Trachymyrmex cornetzi]|uniref:uncharacterized protein LOC108762287 n=1 Tax=Trachymyrmex cornetzi TaxID=471704 RepID=UPI00084F2D6A|nr:PREDICTED: uncharacterized protein LOC108762287 [Trachymyrmex cornetzi]
MAEHKKRILALANAASDKLLRDIMLNMDSEESDESDNDEEILIELRRINIRGCRVKPRRIEGYVEEIIPHLSNNQFREHFRMLPETDELLEQKLANALTNQYDDGRPMIPIRKQLLASLWLLATPDSYRSVGERFDIGKSSLSVSFMRVIDALNEIADDVIQWPQGQKATHVTQTFQQIAGLPNVLEAIDGCYIQMKAPKNNA